jgi:hypothetical protein
MFLVDETDFFDGKCNKKKRFAWIMISYVAARWLHSVREILENLENYF